MENGPLDDENWKKLITFVVSTFKYYTSSNLYQLINYTTMKHLFKFTLLLLALLLPVAALAYDFEVDGIYYNIFNDNEVAVTYKGYSYYAYSDEYSGEVEIPETVTYNGMSYSVTGIGRYAFSGCPVTSVNIPNSISFIEQGAFGSCDGLKRIEIPNSVTSIGIGAFHDCSRLTSIEIPNSITAIAGGLFSECFGLSTIIIPNSVTSIGECSFENCESLLSITIPNSVTSIGSSAFQGCRSLTGIDIPNVVTFLGAHAFDGCESLLTITIPNSVTSIGSGTFQYCKCLTSIDIPNSVTSIGSSAFADCWSLASIDIPNSVTSIGELAFSACGLLSITIPNSVTSIGDCAFLGSSELAKITVDSENQNFDSRNNCNAIIETATNKLIAGCKNTIIPNSISSIGQFAFGDCCGLTHIEIPNSVTFIDDYAFRNCNLISIEIPNSVTSIGDYAFYGCSGLSNVTIPNSVTSIGNHTFEDCNFISTILISGNGEWQGGAINCSTHGLCVDSKITSVKGTKINPYYDVYCYALLPPACDDDTFNNNYGGTLHVPATSLAAYFTADYWCNFANIEGDAIELEEVNISHESVEVNLGNQFNLTATTYPTNATPNDIKWISTDTNIAVVYNGKVTAVSAGECDIIAQCLNKKAICHVVVNDTTVTITLDQQEAMVLPNHIITLTPSASPIFPDLSVASSDPSVAAARVVNNKVQVVGIKEGTTTITVGSADGTAIPATSLVTVYTEPGDLNSDGFVTISDVTSLIDYLLGGDETSITTKNADVNGDGNISISDVTSLIDTLLSGN